MFKIFSILVVIFIANTCLAQTVYVVDELGNPVPDVFVYNEAFQGITDENGIVHLPVVQHVEINFQHLGFGTINFSFQQVESLNYTIVLEGNSHVFEEVELIGRTEKSKREVFQELETIKLENIPISTAQSTPDILENQSGVFVQKTQMGGGSPIVRGFEANKVLLVQDGVRLNNAIYRSGHLHSVLSIDDQSLEKIDLIYGPGSLNYGSDAIGGVLSFVSKQPKFNEQFASYFTAYSSANNGAKAYVDFNLSKGKWSNLTSLAYSHFGDLRTGNVRSEKYPNFGKRPEYVVTTESIDEVISNDNPNIQYGTGYNQWNFLNKTNVIINDHLSISSNIQYSSSSDIPRYDFLTEYKNGLPKYAEWSYGPQKKLFLAGTIDWFKPNKMFDRMKSIFSFQNVVEERITRKFNATNRNTNHEDLDIYGFTTDFSKKITEKANISYGLDFQYNDLLSTANSIHIKDGLRTQDILTRYPNDIANMTSAGIYLSYYQKDLFKNIHSSIGARYQYTNVTLRYKDDGVFKWPDHYYSRISNQNNALTGSIALKWEPNKFFTLNWMSATAFRAPNIDDIAKIRIKRSQISLANSDLEPEKSINHDLNFQLTPFKNKNSYLNMSIFTTQLRDAIVRSPFLLNGKNIFVSQNDTFNIIANVNASSANVKGFSISSQIQINNELKYKISFTKILGEQEIKDKEGNKIISPVSHIPPGYGKMSLVYQKNKLASQISYHYYANKPVDEYGDSSDNFENATIDGTPAYHLFNIEGSYTFNKSVKISVAMKNIFDRHYRLFSSGVSGAGRNLIVSVKGTI